MARSRTPKAAATPVVEAQPVKLGWMDRLLLSETGRKLAQPLSEDEKRVATSSVLTGAAILLTGPVAGSLAAAGVTAVDSSSTKENWRGVGGTACGAIALTATGASVVVASLGGVVSTGIGLIANRLRTRE